MNLVLLQEKAVAVRKSYDLLKEKRGWKTWGTSEYAQGMVGDVGDLVKLIMAKNNLRSGIDVDQKLEHELADCLWSLFIIADELQINIAESFMNTMSGLEEKIQKELRE